MTEEYNQEDHPERFNSWTSYGARLEYTQAVKDSAEGLLLPAPDGSYMDYVASALFRLLDAPRTLADETDPS